MRHSPTEDGCSDGSLNQVVKERDDLHQEVEVGDGAKLQIMLNYSGCTVNCAADVQGVNSDFVLGKWHLLK